MITRLWHGYARPEQASAYEMLVRSEILPGLQQVRGFRGGMLLRRELPGEVEFVGLTYFDSIESMRAAAGDDFGQAIVPETAKALLYRFDTRTAVYEVVVDTRA